MAVPVVIVAAGARPVTNVANLAGAVPMTVADAGAEPVTLVDAGGEPVTLLNEDGSLWDALIADATAYLGLQPYHWFDFVNDRAAYAGADIGTIADIPGLTGTLALSSEGHQITGTGNHLTITSPGVDAPMTVYLEIKRVTDTGGVEYLMQPYASANERGALLVSATDIVTLIPVSGGAATANITVGSAVTTGAVNKIAFSMATDSFNVALDGAAGTRDTSGAVPATPTEIQIGHSSGAATFFGYIRKLAFISSASADGVLTAMTETV